MCLPAVSYRDSRRLRRVGACPILEISVTYPVLEEGEGALLPPAVARFNRAYADMAEALLSWADGAPADAAVEAFWAMGEGAMFRFDRRVVTCEMTVEETHADRLTVRRALTVTTRRGSGEGEEMVARDVWRLPELTLDPPMRKHGKKSAKSL